MKLLRNSAEISAAINELFAHQVRKLALVAFVGKNARDHLPQGVSELTVICWPKAGGTHPDGVSRLVDAGCDVQFCDRLHSKIYWAEGKGMIVGSANLSDNALGIGGLDEYAVQLDSDLPTWLELLAGLSRQPRRVDITSIEKLRIAHRKFQDSNPGFDEDADDKQAGPVALDFEHYFQQALRAKWKVITYTGALSPEEIETQISSPLRKETGSSVFENYNEIQANAPVAEGDFLLQVKISADDDRFIEPTEIRWLYASRILGSFAIQRRRCRPQDEPFAPNEDFKRAFCTVGNAWKQSSSAIADRKGHVKVAFMRAVLDHIDAELW